MKEKFKWWIRVSGHFSSYYLPLPPSTPASYDIKRVKWPLILSHFLSLPSFSVVNLASINKLPNEHILYEIIICGAGCLSKKQLLSAKPKSYISNSTALS